MNNDPKYTYLGCGTALQISMTLYNPNFAYSTTLMRAETLLASLTPLLSSFLPPISSSPLILQPLCTCEATSTRSFSVRPPLKSCDLSLSLLGELFKGHKNVYIYIFTTSLNPQSSFLGCILNCYL